MYACVRACACASEWVSVGVCACVRVCACVHACFEVYACVGLS